MRIEQERDPGGIEAFAIVANAGAWSVEARLRYPDAFYEPNSFNGPVQDEHFREPPLQISGAADRYNHRDGNDDYRQPGDLFRLMSAEQKEQLFQNYKAAMEGVPVEIVKRQIVHCFRADPEYGAGIAKAIGINFTPQTVAAE